MLLFLLICLSITTVVLEHYVLCGFHSKTHRLLPLILGLIALYDFYLIVEFVSGQYGVFLILKDLLLMQMVFLMLYYVLDFTRIKFPQIVNILILSSLIISNILVCTQINHGQKYRNHIFSIAMMSVAIILGTAPVAYYKKRVSKNEKNTYIFMYVTILVPSIALILSMTGVLKEQIAMPVALSVACIIVDRLMYYGKLMDIESYMKTDYYDESDVPALLFDSDIFFLDANQKARQEFSDKIALLLNPETEHIYDDIFRAWVNNPSVDNEVEVDGRFYNCKVNNIIVRKKLRGYIIEIYDITNQKMEVKSKSNFLAYMSHDLRSPLQAIIGGSDIMLQRNEMSVRSRNMARHINSAGKNLLKIVNSILDYSKLEAGKLVIEKGEYDFESMLYDLKHTTKINIGNKPVEFSITMETDYPKHLIGDEMKVRGVFENLISNAVKYTEKGSIDCNIWCNIHGDVVEIVVQVSDTGMGIPEDLQKSIGQDYETGAGANITNSTGLGLSIIKQMTEIMGGGIAIESDGENGTVIRINYEQDLPETEFIKKGELTTKSAYKLAAEWENILAPKWIFPKARVLVADDMKVNRDIIFDFMESWKIQTDFVDDGDLAVEAATNNKYDLIILDINMPRLNGDLAAKKIKELADCPIIGLSANDLENDVFSDYLKKPIEREMLYNTLCENIPTELRAAAPMSEKQYAVLSYERGLESYIRGLQTYANEIEKIRNEIRTVMETDIELFRTKVHGVKGISRQFSKNGIADKSEIMEMAAKVGHIEFINNYIDDYIDSLGITIQETREEIRLSGINLDDVETGEMERDEDGIARTKSDIRTAFENFDVVTAERLIKKLEKFQLSPEEIQLVRNAKKACVEFEYEEGAKLFSRS